MRKWIFTLLLLLLLLSLAACGGEPAPAEGDEETTAVGDAAAGESLFNGGAQPGCNTCHSLEPGVKLAGPSLAEIGAEAGSRVSGQSAEEYLRTSVMEPNSFVVEGFTANIMPATYDDQLSEQEVNDLVAYMLSLK
jgi:mono/diheme cytochrome c family protein